jgi:hypothetical protein
MLPVLLPVIWATAARFFQTWNNSSLLPPFNRKQPQFAGGALLIVAV